jgi:hypothetical protein
MVVIPLITGKTPTPESKEKIGKNRDGPPDFAESTFF